MADTNAIRERRKATSTDILSDEPLGNTAATNSSSPAATETNPTKLANKLAKEEDAAPFSLVDILRSIVFIVIASCGLSYVVTKESFVWGLQRPHWTYPVVIKGYLTGPPQLTDAELPRYDGTNPDLPIYLALNGTIYDVSAGRRHYGPGGSYHFFAGVDATRAFVTNCFEEDRTPDLRGVEDMFLPVDDEVVDAEIVEKFGKGGLKKLRERERREAARSVGEALGHWIGFFENSGKYPRIGAVKRIKGWETKGTPHPMCQKAMNGRKKRVVPEEI